MRRTLRFLACDTDNVLLEMSTLAYRLHAGYELSAGELNIPTDTQVRIELLDDSNHLLDRRTFIVSARAGNDISGISPEQFQATPSRMTRIPR